MARRTLAYNAFRKTLPGCRKHRFYAHSIFRDLRSRNNSSGKELRGMGNKIEKKKKNLILWTKPFHFPISSKIRSIRSLSRSDAHVHVFRVDKRRGTFVLRCVTVIDTVLSIDKFANENVGGKNRFLSKNVWTREGGYKREISRATCHDPLILLLS